MSNLQEVARKALRNHSYVVEHVAKAEFSNAVLQSYYFQSSYHVVSPILENSQFDGKFTWHIGLQGAYVSRESVNGVETIHARTERFTNNIEAAETPEHLSLFILHGGKSWPHDAMEIKGYLGRINQMAGLVHVGTSYIVIESSHAEAITGQLIANMREVFHLLKASNNA